MEMHLSARTQRQAITKFLRKLVCEPEGRDN